jgi:hypothetical protein
VMEDLTLDICVLISGSGISDPNTNKTYGKMSRELMDRMISDNRYFLALDSKKKIETQYLSKLNPQTFGHVFVRQMATMGKIATIEWNEINRGVRVQLEQRGFTRDNEDYKFVIVASGACCKKLITHEPHFFGVRHILSSIGVAVLVPNQV